jgi:hypothetical protein
VVTERPQKTEVNQPHITVGGNQITYPGSVTTRTAGLSTINILLNSVDSTTDARFVCVDVKNFYLNTPMNKPEYMAINLDLSGTWPTKQRIHLHQQRNILPTPGRNSS